MRRAFHPAAWTTWTIAAALVAQRTTEPVLLGAALAALVYTAVSLAADRGPVALMLKVGLGVLVIRVLLFALTGHPGGTTLFTLPEIRLPVALGGFHIGGPIAAEVVAHSAAEGLRLAVVLVCFGVFLSVVEPARVVRLAPRFLFEAGLVVAIAVTFVPSLVRTARDVREAQRLRGYRARGLRAAAALALPVLSSTLERAGAIAESMESRGYGRARGADARAESRARVWAFAGVCAASAGALGVALKLRPAWALAALGAASTGVALRRLSALAARTRYRRERLRGADAAVIALALGHVAAAFAVPLGRPGVGGVAVACAFAAPVAVDGARGAWLRARSAEGAGDVVLAADVPAGRAADVPAGGVVPPADAAVWEEAPA